MRYEDASLSGSFQDQGPVARDDTDALAAGDRGPATGNVITGIGTQTGAAGADTATAAARITGLSGAGGNDSAFEGGRLRVEGEHGTLSLSARGDFSYQANAGVPENSRDLFTYTLSDAGGTSSQARLLIEIGKTPAVVQTNAQRVVPGPDGVVVLPAGVELSDIRIVGRDLLIMLPDGSQMLIVDGAVFVPQLVINDIEVPSTNLAALLIEQEPRPASGVPRSSGGNFIEAVGPLDPGTPLGDLLPPTQLQYTPPEFRDAGQELDREPEVGANPLIQMDDDARPGGNAGGTGDDADAVNVTGTLSGSGGDGPLTFALSTSGAPSGFTYVAGQNGTLLVQQNGVTVLTVTVNAQTGAYSVVQNAVITHAAGGDENNAVFTFGYTVTDQDGDQAAGTFQVNVDDDTPVVDVTAGADAAVTLVTDDFDTRGPGIDSASSTVNFSGVFGLTQSVGADGLGSAAALTYALGTPGGASGLTQAGVAINLFLVGGKVVGSTASTAGGITAANTVFDVAVSNTGVVTLTQYGQIDHAVESTTTAPFNDQLASLADSLVTLTGSATVTDKDGDTATDSAVVQIGANIRFTDDGPSLGTVRAGTGLTLDETEAGSPSGFPIDETSAAPVISGDAETFGADGPAATGSKTFGLSIVGNGATQLRTAQTDQLITLVQNAATPNVVTGVYGNGLVAFTVTINANGTLTVVQNVPLEHLVDGNTEAAYDDALNLAGLINATITVRDFDGDTATGSAGIGDLIVFKDDGPDAALSDAGKPQLILDETRNVGTDTPGGQAPAGLDTISVNVAGNFAATTDYGADGAGSVSYALVLNGSDVASGLFALGANGQPGAPILLNLVNGQIVGTAGGQTYFTISLSGSTVTFTQAQAIYHGNTGSLDEAAVLNLATGTIVVRQTVTDSDGDFDTANLDLSSGVFSIQDDGPDARVDGSVVLGTVILDESEPDGTDTAGGSAPGGLDSGTLALGANFFANAIDYGSDGAGSVSYALTVTPAAQGGTVGSGLFALQPGDTSTGDGDGYGRGAEIQLVQVSATEVAGRIGDTTYFSLTINAAGTVTFTQILPIWNPTPGTSYDELASLIASGGQLLATQTVTDRDGDSDTATINLSNGVFGIQDDGPSITAEAADKSVGEGQTVTGAFTFDVGEDGGGITAVNGSAVTFVNGQAVINLDKGVLTLQSNGSYSFQANNPGSGTQTVTVTITDGDGDTITTDFVLTVTDINAPTAGEASASVDDDGLVVPPDGVANGEPGDVNANIGDLNGPASSEATFRGNLNANFGGDGAGVTGTISFAVMANTTATVGTETVRYTLSQDGLTLTATTEGGTRPGTALFTVTLDGPQSTGYTVTLLDNVLHAAGNGETGTSVSPAINFTITDADGSPATGSLAISFNDDIPTATISFSTAVQEPVLTTQDAETDGNPKDTDTDVSSANFGEYVLFTPNGGADGIKSEQKEFALSVENGASGLTSGGQAITLYRLNDGTVIGTTGANTGAIDANTVFAITVSGTGVVTLSQYKQVDHDLPGEDGGPFDDQFEVLLADKVNLDITYRVTDGDDDIVTATQQVDLGGNIRFADDGPTALDIAGPTFGENAPVVIALPGGNSFGADGAATSGSVVITQQPAQGIVTYNAQTNSFTYTPPPGGFSGPLSFTYQLKDFDGDTDTATVSFAVAADSTPTVTAVDLTVDEKGLPARPGESAGSDAAGNSEISSTQQLTISTGGDTLAKVEVQNNVGAWIDVTGGTQGAPVIVQGNDGFLTVYKDAGGNFVYFYTLTDNLENHPDNLTNDGDGDRGAADPLAGDSFAVRVTDSDNSQSPVDTINVTVLDDGPDARVTGTIAQGAVVLDESEPDGTDTTGGTAPGGLDSGTLSLATNFFANAIIYGADSGTVAYTLEVVPAVQGGSVGSGIYALDTSDKTATVGDGYGQGAEIQLVQVSPTLVEGRANGQTYFTLSINGSGTVTFTQLLSVYNPTPGSSFDEAAILQAVGGQLIARQTVTDGDGDKDSATIDLSNGVFQIQDDGPAILTPAVDKSVGEGQTVTGAFSFDVGEDGGGITAVNGTAVTFTNGQAVIVLTNGTLTLQSNGSYSFQANNPASGTQAISITVTDGDGDTITDDVLLTITDVNTPNAGAASASVDDDGLVSPPDAPANGEPGDVNANIGDLDGPASSEATFRGNLNAGFGLDGAGSISFAAMDNTTATVGTETVRYDLSDDGLTLTAITEGGTRPGTALFSVKLDSAQSTGYTVTLLDNVLHTAGGDETGTSLTPVINFTITDADGSSANGTLTINFNDDIPVFGTVTNPLVIANSGNVANTGQFQFNLGGDGAPANNDVVKSLTLNSVTVNGVAATNVTLVPGTEDATTASYTLSFTYPTGTGSTATTTGTVVINKATQQYTVDLDGPVQSFTMLDTGSANASAFVEASPTVTNATLRSDFVVQFTGVTSGNGNFSTGDYPLNNVVVNDNAPGTLSPGEIFTAPSTTVQVSNTAAGVAGNTLQGNEVLNFSLYSSDPGANTGLAPTASSSSMYLVFDGVGNAEDLIVNLVLQDPDTGEIITRAVVIQNSDLIKGPTDNNPATATPSLPAPYQGIILDNNDAFVVIESNDYNLNAGENFVIIGGQIAGSETNISGAAINLNGALGAGGGSTFGSSLSADTDSNAPIKIVSVGFLTQSSQAQSATLDFTAVIQDADGDTATTNFQAVVGDAAPAAAATMSSSSSLMSNNDTGSSNLLVSDSGGSNKSTKFDIQSQSANNNLALMAGLAAGFAAPAAASTDTSFGYAVNDAGDASFSLAYQGGYAGSYDSADIAATQSLSLLDDSNALDVGSDVGSEAVQFFGTNETGELVTDAADGGTEAGFSLDTGTELASPASAAAENAQAFFGGGEIHLPGPDQMAALANLGQGNGNGAGKPALEQVLSDALSGGGNGDIDQLIQAAVKLAGPALHKQGWEEADSVGGGNAPAVDVATQHSATVPGWDAGHFSPLFQGPAAAMESHVLHPDAVQPVANG